MSALQPSYRVWDREPSCPKCRLAMQWQRTRRTFTMRGMGLLSTFACQTCDEIVQREEQR
jgi:hypothetical protein